MDEIIKREIIRMKTDPTFLLPVKNYNSLVGFLRPITYFDIGDDSIINNLTNWRNENITAYLNHQLATFEGTRRWLSKFILDNKNKILFILYSENNEPIGHMGLADGLDTKSYIEMDNIVRGIKSIVPGIITLALYDLITWVFLHSNADKVYLRVFSDNLKALNMYKNLKFKEEKRFSLEESTVNGILNYSIVNKNNVSGKYFSYMELKRNQHFHNYKFIKDWKSK